MSDGFDGRHVSTSYTPEGDDAREGFRAAAAGLGGNPVPIVFTAEQEEILNAVTDGLIPPGDGFPAPSEVGVGAEFVPRYVAPKGQSPVRFPGAEEGSFKASLDALGKDFLALDEQGRIEQLRRLEREDETFFGQLRALTYAGYYSRPAVVLAIRANLEAGADYHGPPLPYGYESTTMDWGELTPAADRGRYLETAAVTRVRQGSRP